MRNNRQAYIKERLLFGPHTCTLGLCGQDGICAVELPGETIKGEKVWTSETRKIVLLSRLQGFNDQPALPGTHQNASAELKRSAQGLCPIPALGSLAETACTQTLANSLVRRVRTQPGSNQRSSDGC